MDGEPGRYDFGVRILADAYIDLSTCRGVGFGVGPIPIWAIWAWADRRGIDVVPGAVEVLEDIIFAVDAETMRRARKPKPGT